MAISKAARWITFGNTPSAAPAVQQAALAPVLAPVYGSDEKQFGFTNFGNTCYANSVLQALYFCSPFRDLVLQSIDASASSSSSAPAGEPTTLAAPPMLRRQSAKRLPSEPTPSATQDDHAAIPVHPPTLFSALRSLFMYISKHPAEKGTVAPRAFVDKLKAVNELFQGTQHQDAHEFLNYLLNKIVEEIQTDRNHRDGPLDGSHDDLSASVGTLSSGPAHTSSSSSSYEPTLVQRLFEGVLTSETRCLTCETVTSRDESFLDLSIDIEQNSSVTACLRQFSASEMLCQKNKFFCDSCAGLQEAEKRMKIKKLPNILALHLKRFKYQEDIQKYIKLTYRVAFPLELRLFNTVDDAPDPDRLYELFAIVIHIGAGPHHGHYITIIKGPHSWLVYDDDKIETIKESEISKYFGDAPGGAAYVLFYEAVNLEPTELGIRPAPPRAAPADVPAPLPVVKLTEAANGTVVPVSTPPGLKPVSSQDELLVSQDGRSEASTSTSAPSSPVIVPQLNARSTPALSVITSGERLPPPMSQINGHATSPLTSPKSTSGGSLKRKLKGADAASSSPRDPSPRRPRTAPGPTSPTRTPHDAPPVPPLPEFKVDGVADVPKSPGRKRSKWFRRSMRAMGRGDEKDEREKKDDERETIGTSSIGSVSHSMVSAPSQSSMAETAASGSSVFRRASLRMTQGHTGHARRVSAGTFEPPPPLASASGSTQPASQSEELRAHVPVTGGKGLPLEPVPGTPSGVDHPRINGHASNGSPVTPQLQRLASADVFNSAPTAVPPTPPANAEQSTPTRTARRDPDPPTPTRSALRGASTASPPLSPPPRSPARPKTASGAERATRNTVAVPMPPPSPSALKAAAMSDGEAAHAAKKEHRTSHHTRDLIDKLRPQSAHGPGHGPGFTHGHRPSTSISTPSVPSIPTGTASVPPQLNGAADPTTSSRSNAAPHEKEKEGGKAGFKRAARKLSITGAMFGLGKDKERERRTTRPPSAFLAPGTPR